MRDGWRSLTDVGHEQTGFNLDLWDLLVPSHGLLTTLVAAHSQKEIDNYRTTIPVL